MYNITLIDKKQSIVVNMFDIMKEKRLQVTFEGGAICYRGQIRGLSPSEQGNWPIYTTEYSPYIKWFLHESFGIYSETELLQYIFLGKNIIFDIIHTKDYEPLVEVFD